MRVEMLFLRSKKGVPSSSGRSSSRGPGGQTAPGSCRKPAGSPQETGVSGKATRNIYLAQKTCIVHEAGHHFKKLSSLLIWCFEDEDGLYHYGWMDGWVV